MKELIIRNKYFYFTVLLFVIIGGIILSFISKETITIWVNSRWFQTLDKIVLLADNIGTVVFSVCAVLLIWILKGWKIALKASLCFFAVMLVTQFGKHILYPGQPRPTLHFEEDILRLLDGVKQLSTESFPSGHTSASFAIATFFALYFPFKKWHVLLALLALFVGYGRIYLSQHFFTDVYAGMIVGVIVTTLVYYFYPKQWEEDDSKSQKIH